MTIITEDTKREIEVDDTRPDLYYDIQHHILGANIEEGRERDTFWDDLDLKEKYRIERLAHVGK
jgi:hypothetical protein